MSNNSQSSNIKDYLKNLRPKVLPNVETFEESGDALVYSPTASHAIALNPTALAILDLCDGTLTTLEIVKVLCEETGADEPAVMSGVVNTLLSLRENHVVEIEGLARRVEAEQNASHEKNFYNDRLDFRLPDFTRLMWVSDTAREAWEPRLQKVTAAWNEIEWRSVVAGLRRCALTSLSPQDLVEFSATLLKEGLTTLPVAVHDASHGYSSNATSPKPGQPISFRVAIGAPSDVLAMKQAIASKDDNAIGELLGFPSCCRDFFRQHWVDHSMIDTTWPMALRTSIPLKEEPDSPIIEVSHSTPLEANILWRWAGIRAVPHLPCSFQCESTAQLGQELLNLGITIGYAQEVAWLKEVLSWPVEWSALHGIAEVKTPILKISTRTDATAHKFVVRKQGMHYPEEGAVGLDFPYRSPDKHKLTGSTGYQKGLEHATTVNDTTAEWLARDNGFTSTEAMDEAHKPIVELAAKTLPEGGASILDLGCGNGVLLKKICSLKPQTVPFGMDLDQERVDHAKMLLPEFSENFVAGNIFEDLDKLFDDDTRYTMALLMPGRLTEVPDEKSLILKEKLRRHCKYLLLYAYGDWLARDGSLAGLARRVGIKIDSATLDSPVTVVKVNEIS